MAQITLTKPSLRDVFPASGLGERWKPALLSEVPEAHTNDIARARASLEEAEFIIKQQQEHIRRLEGLALTDELTGLLNRRGFTLALQRELSLSQRDAAAGGVLVMIDLDGFKSINDVWGHSVGDDYLQAVAHALLGSVRGGDVVARLGGDEFVILFTHMDEQAGLKRLARLEQSFNSRMMHFDNKTLPLRASFGLSSYSGHDSPDAILAAADRRLYEHKAQRRTMGH